MLRPPRPRNVPESQTDLEDSIAPSRHLKPELLWPSLKLMSDGGCTSVDDSTCPTNRDVIEKRAKGNYNSPTFWRAIEDVKELYILDSYFHSPAMEMLYVSIKKNQIITSIKLLYGERHIDESTFIKYKNKLKKECEQRGCILRIKEHYQPRNYPHIHDRFVLADNELWHFGANVGGSYEGISAISRGWDGQTHQFKTLFGYAFHKTRVTR